MKRQEQENAYIHYNLAPHSKQDLTITTPAESLTVIVGDHAQCLLILTVTIKTIVITVNTGGTLTCVQSIRCANGQTQKQTCTLELRGNHAQATVNIIAITEQQSALLLKTEQHHRAPDTKSDLSVLGSIKDRSHSAHTSMITVLEQCKRVVTRQKTELFLMSAAATCQATPAIDIHAHDTRCDHGAACGQLPPAHLHYCMAHGMTQEQAQDLLFEGIVQTRCQGIQLPDSMNFCTKLRH